MYRRAVQRATEREATTRPVNAEIALFQEMLASGAPETTEHAAAIKDADEAAARRDAETGDAAAFREGDALDRIARYRSAHERSLARSLDALARLTA